MARTKALSALLAVAAVAAVTVVAVGSSSAGSSEARHDTVTPVQNERPAHRPI